jgi:hypothetical protein
MRLRPKVENPGNGARRLAPPGISLSVSGQAAAAGKEDAHTDSIWLGLSMLVIVGWAVCRIEKCTVAGRVNLDQDLSSGPLKSAHYNGFFFFIRSALQIDHR